MVKKMTKQWADGPFSLIPTPISTGSDPTDSFVQTATDMAHIHNLLLRGLNSIYLQAPHVPPSDYADFILYSITWSKLLSAHHHGEEELLFPTIERLTEVPGVMAVNVAQHDAFAAGISEYDKYLAAMSSTPEAFDGQKLVAIIDSFANVLKTHLADEIPTMLALAQYRDKLNLHQLFQDEGEQVMGKVDKELVVSFFVTNNDFTFEGGHDFPTLPWLVKKLLMPWVWPWPNRRLWKFSSCTTGGIPKELEYAPVKVEASK